jgi:hypothetical protein
MPETAPDRYEKATPAGRVASGWDHAREPANRRITNCIKLLQDGGWLKIMINKKLIAYKIHFI